VSAPHPEPRRPAPRPPGVLQIGTVAGSPVYVTPSWFLIAILWAVLVAPYVDEVEPGLGPLKYVVGVVFAIILYGAVLLHEASHAVVARHYGYPVGPITLHFLGGATTIEEESRRPRDEFWIAVVGPLTSLAIGGVAFGVREALDPDGLVEMALAGLIGSNLIVGVLNLVPGLPLDGGRVMRSAVWGVTRDMHKGTMVAGWIGRGTAVLALGWPLVQERITGNTPSTYGFFISVAVAIFLWTGASASMANATVRSRLPHLVARTLARRAIGVPSDLPLAEAVRRAQEAQAGSIITTTADGTPIGLVNETALLRTPEDRRPWMPASAVARSIEPGLRLPWSIEGEELIRAITRTPAQEYLLVQDDGSVYGVLTTADVDAAFKGAAR
jgi:Zn-dependent protease